jgi:hypothetical protein
MPARGARTTDVAFQTALILRTSNAGPRLAAWQHIARQIHSRGRPTGLPPEVGIPPTRRGGIGAAIREIFPATVGFSRFRQLDFSVLHGTVRLTP